ncbi:hypothetical protein IFM89_003034 [Coptis chinensis]|uniref:Uncharacterized protein n=1 Tax=Coptis chinensis TaxID=261450 RepID=A0A835IQV9_9MAGN|nr:hypothetical protein IFM89_003034 [Coptis chinensis]
MVPSKESLQKRARLSNEQGQGKQKIKKEKSREKRVWAVVMYNYGKAKVESGGGGDVREVREKREDVGDG